MKRNGFSDPQLECVPNLPSDPAPLAFAGASSLQALEMEPDKVVAASPSRMDVTLGP